MQKKVASITGIGSYLPERVLSNSDLEKMVDTTDEWIRSRTGISQRHIARSDETTAEMGTLAAEKALVDAGLAADQIDLILVATITPDYTSNNTAALIQCALQAKRAAALDVQAACSGFIYGLSVAKAFIESGMYRTILFIAAEKMSAYVDYTDRSTCVLFGDGASAVIVSDRPGMAIEGVSLGADGALAEMLLVPAGGTKQPASQETVNQRLHFFKMKGSEVFKHAVRKMTASAEESLKLSHLSINQIHWVVPHQANIRIIDAVADACHVPTERVYRCVDRYGNTSAASIPLALDELRQRHPLAKGDNLLLVAFGAGLTWGSCILKIA